jgi:SAM-dependent methyltransferase
VTESSDLSPGSMRRSMVMYRALRDESDPQALRQLIAGDAVRQIGEYAEFPGEVVLDVGARSPYLADAVMNAGAKYLAVGFPRSRPVSQMLDEAEAEAGSAAAVPGGVASHNAVFASPVALPVRSGAVGICYSADVLHQVGDPEHMAGEMVRVTRPGGLVFLCFVPWFSLAGGHETAPWHYFGGQFAARRYERATGSSPQNRYGENLFAVSVSRMVHWAHGRGDIASVELVPRYFPSWARWVLHVPGLREMAARNVAMVLRVR